jgi:septum formation protein
MALWLSDKPLVLASKSAARRSLLEAAGVQVESQPADIDERAIEARAGSGGWYAVASLLAREKARTVAARLPGRFVLGADQTLSLGTRRFSKPPDRAAAREQLAALRGKTHALHSALAIMRDGELLFDHADVARMTMRDFSDAFLDGYLDAVGDAVTRSVGCYQFEGAGAQLFERVEGHHSTILGLPLLPLLGFLRNVGLLAK